MKTTYLFFKLALVISSPILAQNTVEILPIYSPKEVHLKILSNQESISKDYFISTDNANISLQAVNPKEPHLVLSVSGFRVDLVRNGQLISWDIVNGHQCNLSDLMEIAENGDVFNFTLENIHIHLGDQTLVYGKGHMNFHKYFQTDKIKLARK